MSAEAVVVLQGCGGYGEGSLCSSEGRRQEGPLMCLYSPLTHPHSPTLSLLWGLGRVTSLCTLNGSGRL